MQQGIVIGSVPAMHYRPFAGRSPLKVDAETALLIREAVHELLGSHQDIVDAFVGAFQLTGVNPDDIRFVFWSWPALQTVAKPQRAQLQAEPFPAIFSFAEKDEIAQIHPCSVFRNAVHYVSSRDRKTCDKVDWGNLPY